MFSVMYLYSHHGSNLYYLHLHRNLPSKQTYAHPKSDNSTKLICHGIVKPLCKLSSFSDIAGYNALAALVSLSSDGTSMQQCVEDMIDCGAINRMSEIALSFCDKDASNTEDLLWRKRVNYAIVLLANMTRIERGSVDLFGLSEPDQLCPSKPNMTLLLSRFLSTVFTDNSMVEEYENESLEDVSSSAHDPYQHFSSVLMNATQINQGMKFITKIHQAKNDKNSRPTSILQQILPQLRSTNPLRRQGIAGTIRNCCFEKDSAWWLIHEVNVVNHILYPLAGPEELDDFEKKGMDPDLYLDGPDKVREPIQTTRLLLVEAILLLCASGRKSRESLRVKRTYVVIKLADMAEESEDVSEVIGDCVQYLRRDEFGTTEGSSDRFIEDFGKEKLTLPLSTTAQIEVDVDEDYDDVD